jgi:AmmeMemoRadiSam system protein B
MRPTLEEIRARMGIPSAADVRGQLDAVGYATTPEGMAKVWELSAGGPRPEPLGGHGRPGVIGALGPHDDYIYAARVYREIFPLVTARTVVIVGVFHRYRQLAMRDVLVFDPYRAWRSPEGEIPVSALREDLLARLPGGMAVKDAGAHDSEHSIEGIAYFLRHARPDLEIVPIIVPAASFERLAAMAQGLGRALADSLAERGWRLGQDAAIVISTDGTHYGDDFRYSPHGAGGVAAFERAVAHDRALVRETLAAPLGEASARAFYSTVVDPANPDQYRVTWCGRFSVTFGMLLLADVAARMGLPPPRGEALALGASVDAPELAIRAEGMGPTAPANLYHFVTHPAVAYS